MGQTKSSNKLSKTQKLHLNEPKANQDSKTNCKMLDDIHVGSNTRQSQNLPNKQKINNLEDTIRNKQLNKSNDKKSNWNRNQQVGKATEDEKLTLSKSKRTEERKSNQNIHQQRNPRNGNTNWQRPHYRRNYQKTSNPEGPKEDTCCAISFKFGLPTEHQSNQPANITASSEGMLPIFQSCYYPSPSNYYTTQPPPAYPHYGPPSVRSPQNQYYREPIRYGPPGQYYGSNLVYCGPSQRNRGFGGRTRGGNRRGRSEGRKPNPHFKKHEEKNEGTESDSEE